MASMGFVRTSGRARPSLNCQGLHRATQRWGSTKLCDYLAIPDYRREIHTLLNRGESVPQLQRAIHGGHAAPERGRRRRARVAISGAHSLLTNMVLAWNTRRMDSIVARRKGGGVGIEEDWLRRVGPVHFSHINVRGRSGSTSSAMRTC